MALIARGAKKASFAGLAELMIKTRGRPGHGLTEPSSDVLMVHLISGVPGFEQQPTPYVTDVGSLGGRDYSEGKRSRMKHPPSPPPEAEAVSEVDSASTTSILSSGPVNSAR